MKRTIELHEGTEYLSQTFEQAWKFLNQYGRKEMKTDRGKMLTAEAATSKDGEPIIIFRQSGKEYGRSYDCCWGHKYNCNRTRIGSYCRSLDNAEMSREGVKIDR